MRSAARTGTIGLAVGGLLALLALWPLLRRGYVLTYDMVFVPEPGPLRSLLGVDGTVARGVPSDGVAALLGVVMPADIVQKALLAGAFAIGGWGVARLVPGRPAARAAAAAFAVWNAWVYERLVLGHWTLLLAAAALPWAVERAAALRRDPRRALPGLALALAAGAATGASGTLVVVGTALAVAGVPGRGERWVAGAARAGLVLALGLILSLPWLVPTLTRPGGLPPRPEAVAVFAARADTPLGVLGSLLTLGGAWNADVVPPGRDSWAAVPALVLLTGLALWGLAALPRTAGRDPAGAGGGGWVPGAAAGLVLAAGAALVVAVAGALPLPARALRALVAAVPAAGVLRDGQRYLLPLVLAQAVGYGVAADRLLARAGRARGTDGPGAARAGRARGTDGPGAARAGRARGTDGPGAARAGRALRAAAAAVLVLAPVGVLPVLAGGAGGRLAAVTYPKGYASARAAMAADPVPGAVLVLPWSQYAAPAWNGGRPVADPGPRWAPRRAVASADLTVRDAVIPGEDPWAALAAPAARGDRPLVPALPGLGVRWVLLSKVGDWRAQAARLAGLDVVVDTPALRLHRAPPPGPPPVDLPPSAPAAAGTAAAAAVPVVAVAVLLARRARGPAASLPSADEGAGPEARR